MDIYNIFTKARTTLVSTKNDTSKSTLLEHYKFVGLQDTAMTGECYFTFTTKMKDIEFSLSKELDSLKGMKLQRVHIINDARYLKAANIYLQKAESAYSIEELTLTNSPEIDGYFKMFRKKLSK